MTTSSQTPQVRTLLLTDMVDSTGLVERLGDNAAAELFRAHDRVVLELQQRWRGRLIDRSDGLLLIFERPIDGLGFALDYVRGLRELGRERGLKQPLQARAGLHVGEILVWENSAEAVRVGAKSMEVEGLAKPLAGRLMALARPGQILLSATAEPLAHRAARELGERGELLVWKSYGRWRFKGLPEAQEVFEVGEPGFAPLRMPPHSPKAFRDLPLWRRPAALAVEALLLAVVVTGGWFLSRPQPAIAFAERDWVVVGDVRNLTGDARLDDSLEQAFRISLEQSPYVNLLSDLKVRETLQRMQRKPDVAVDRAIGSEIALRDGARALLLPTIAEVGGRLRVSAEVVDPRTQATVYAVSADGSGIESALGSIDKVTAELRGKLGEALRSVEKDSVPLPQVTTRNLDALRAYALGVEAYGNSKSGEALHYFQRAIQLDPDFALAYMGLIRVHISMGEIERVKPYFAKALALRGHLTARDALYLDAWSADFDPRATKTAPEKWKLLTGMYPDYYAGHANYAWAAFAAGQYKEALSSAQAAAVPKNALRGLAFDQVGRIQLAQEQYAAALDSFRRTTTAERPGGRQYAAALAATRKFKEAQAVIDKLPVSDLSSNFERIAIAVDQGRWVEARRISAQAVVLARKKDPLLDDLFSVLDLSVLGLLGRGTVSANEYQSAIEAILEDRDASNNIYASDRVYFALATIYLAQRAGHGEVGKQNIPRLTELVDQVGDARAEQMLGIVQAGQLRLAGNAPEAVTQLRKLVNGQELFQVRVALRDALREAGQFENALRENRWLASHRGRAYAELAGGYVLQALNVADTTLAHLDSSEILKRLGRKAEAQREAEAFRSLWKPSELPDYLRRRLETTLPASKQ